MSMIQKGFPYSSFFLPSADTLLVLKTAWSTRRNLALSHDRLCRDLHFGRLYYDCKQQWTSVVVTDRQVPHRLYSFDNHSLHSAFQMQLFITQMCQSKSINNACITLSFCTCKTASCIHADKPTFLPSFLPS